MMKINKIYAGIGILIALTFLLSSYVSAFGIGSAYHQDHPLALSPGETTDITFNLQNMAGSESISAKATIEKGSEIMSLVEANDIYVVPVGGSIDVTARVTIPSNAAVGDVYPIAISFTTITKSESGTFGFGSSVSRSFDVIVAPKEEAKLSEEKPSTSWSTYLTVGIAVIILVAVILVIWFILKRKR